jgi:hypothetical protein
VAKQRSTFGKLERARAKQARAKAKQERRVARGASEAAEPTVRAPRVEDESELLSKLAELQEAFDDGRMSLEDFEARRDDLRSRLTVD